MAEAVCARQGWTEQVSSRRIIPVDPEDPPHSTEFGPETGGIDSDQDGKAGLWIVLVARRNILEANSREVRQELDHLLGTLEEADPEADRRS